MKGKWHQRADALNSPHRRRRLASAPERPWLVIGFGNTLRRDDGAGVRLAEAVEALGLPGVRVVTCHQLTPELAASIAEAGGVVFADAALDLKARPRWRKLRSAAAPASLAHASDPRALLSLAQALYGHAPPAWMLTLPAPDLDYGEGLSPVAQQGVAAALRRLSDFLRR